MYLDGNSLGMAPRATLDRIAGVAAEEWAHGLIRSWQQGQWLDLPTRVGDRLAPVIGAPAGSVVVHDSTTVGLYQLVHAALAWRPDRTVIAVEPTEFPTDRYVVAGIARSTGATIRAGFADLDDVAVVVRSLVDYRTAAVVDLRAEATRAAEAGAVVVWDLSHAAGAIEVDLAGAGVELAVGCTYKFLHGGPGAPAWAYVAPERQAELDQPIWGWFADATSSRWATTSSRSPTSAASCSAHPGSWGWRRPKSASGSSPTPAWRRSPPRGGRSPGSPSNCAVTTDSSRRPRRPDPAGRARRRPGRRRRRRARRAHPAGRHHRHPPPGSHPPRLRRPHHPVRRRVRRRTALAEVARG